MKVKIQFVECGYCTQLERNALSDGNFKSIKFPMMVGIIEHPTKGIILYDTGYSRRFFSETSKFPLKIYAHLTPVHFRDEDHIHNHLKKMGKSVKDVSHIVVSHFHADHIGALLDFPEAKYIYMEKAFSPLNGLKGFKALRHGFLPGLIPSDFSARSILVEQLALMEIPHPAIKTAFGEGYDLLGDGSLMGIELPGHAEGQLGVFLSTEAQDYFLVSDGCWRVRTYKEQILPSKLALFITDKTEEYKSTIAKIHRIHKTDPTLEIRLSHEEQ